MDVPGDKDTVKCCCPGLPLQVQWSRLCASAAGDMGLNSVLGGLACCAVRPKQRYCPLPEPLETSQHWGWCRNSPWG